MAKANILIASPTGGSVKTPYVKAILSTMMDLVGRGMDVSYETEEGSDLALQRNVLINSFLTDKKFSHILFVDSDMAFPMDTAWRMFAAGKPVIGIICTSRSYDYSKTAQALKEGADPDRAMSYGFDWLLYLPEEQQSLEIGSIVEVDAIGFGVIMIARAALEVMIARHVARKFKHPTRGTYYDFFYSRPEDITNAEHFSEDVSFCRRWRRDCGSKIWALTVPAVYHIGDYSFGGSFGDHMSTLAADAGRAP